MDTTVYQYGVILSFLSLDSHRRFAVLLCVIMSEFVLSDGYAGSP